MEHPSKIVKVVAEAAKVLSAVIGIAALVLQFVPGVDVALDGLFLATTLIALAGDSYLAALGHGNWGVAALDGLSVAMIGAGSLLGSAGEVAGSAGEGTAEAAGEGTAEAAGEAATSAATRATQHGAKRLAERGFTSQDIALTESGQSYTQADGVVTALKNISESR